MATAADRAAVLTTSGVLVNGLASGLATLDEKICLSNTYVPRARRDRDKRWATVSARLDDASRTAGRLADQLREAAHRAEKVVAAGEDVEYIGSLTDHHGRYTLAGRCTCDDPDCEGLTLTHGLQNATLICVNAFSIAPVAASSWAPLIDVANAGYRLDTDPRALPDGLPVEPAITIVRGMSAITSRIRAVLTAWHDPFVDRLTQRCLINISGFGYAHGLARGILDDLDRIRPDLTVVRTHLRTAIGVLAEIEASQTSTRAA
ncbi:hypothetical protein AB0M02_41110 [Actinoplanes sp. NPDC051861]|uniref:hypothetical protein n=1 Tax=Actinoplanes sp. NPDC051861 TaxID=3155170 RepID=UPI0034220745